MTLVVVLLPVGQVMLAHTRLRKICDCLYSFSHFDIFCNIVWTYIGVRVTGVLDFMVLRFTVDQLVFAFLVYLYSTFFLPVGYYVDTQSWFTVSFNDISTNGIVTQEPLPGHDKFLWWCLMWSHRCIDCCRYLWLAIKLLEKFACSNVYLVVLTAETFEWDRHHLCKVLSTYTFAYMKSNSKYAANA